MKMSAHSISQQTNGYLMVPTCFPSQWGKGLLFLYRRYLSANRCWRRRWQARQYYCRVTRVITRYPTPAADLLSSFWPRDAWFKCTAKVQGKLKDLLPASFIRSDATHYASANNSFHFQVQYSSTVFSQMMMMMLTTQFVSTATPKITRLNPSQANIRLQGLLSVQILGRRVAVLMCCCSSSSHVRNRWDPGLSMCINGKYYHHRIPFKELCKHFTSRRTLAIDPQLLRCDKNRQTVSEKYHSTAIFESRACRRDCTIVTVVFMFRWCWMWRESSHRQTWGHEPTRHYRNSDSVLFECLLYVPSEWYMHGIHHIPRSAWIQITHVSKNRRGFWLAFISVCKWRPPGCQGACNFELGRIVSHEMWDSWTEREGQRQSGMGCLYWEMSRRHNPCWRGLPGRYDYPNHFARRRSTSMTWTPCCLLAFEASLRVVVLHSNSASFTVTDFMSCIKVVGRGNASLLNWDRFFLGYLFSPFREHDFMISKATALHLCTAN